MGVVAVLAGLVVLVEVQLLGGASTSTSLRNALIPASAVFSSVVALSSAVARYSPSPSPSSTSGGSINIHHRCGLQHDPPKPVGARVRPMVQAHPIQGWMSWAEYGCAVKNCDAASGAGGGATASGGGDAPPRCISEALFLHVGREMVRLGLVRAGFDYIFIDDCWMTRHRPSGAIEADPARFPHGIAWLADQLHAMFVTPCSCANERRRSVSSAELDSALDGWCDCCCLVERAAVSGDSNHPHAVLLLLCCCCWWWWWCWCWSWWWRGGGGGVVVVVVVVVVVLN
jgi:hypothetical protein